MAASTVEQNKAFMARIIERNDAKDFYEYMGGVADDFVGYNDMVPGGIQGPKALSDFFYVTEAVAFPDGTHTIYNLFGEDNMVALEVTYKGTFTGPLPGGIQPNGKVVDFRNNIICKFNDEGKLAELWWYPISSFQLMKDLGVIPSY